MGTARDRSAAGTTTDSVSREVEVLRAHLERHAGRYFGKPKATQVAVVLSSSSVRPASRLYRFAVTADGQSIRVLCKVPRRRTERGTRVDRPRLVEPASSADKSGLEYSALVSIARAFEAMDDERFAWVRPFDHLPALGAVVMELDEARDLRPAVRGGLIPVPSRRLRATQALERCGAWLRAFGSVDVSHARPRLVHRTEVGDALTRLGSYVSAHLAADGLRDEIDELFRRAATDAVAALPAEAPVALGHGDVAPRNMLLRSDGRVLMIDTLARWRTSPLEDLAYARMSLIAPTIMAPRMARAWAEECGEAVLRGWFGTAAVPWRQLSIYGLLVLADRWAAELDRRPARRGIGHVLSAFRDRAYGALARSVLDLSAGR